MDETLKWLLYFLGGIVIVLILFILFSFKKSGPIVVSLLTIGPAYLLGGGIIGFLFAIPRSGVFRYKENGDTSKSWYYDNANLEDVSDWLTKIIVGLTLVQFDKILDLTDKSARSISYLFEGPCEKGCKYYSLSYGLIIFFTACGFAISYLWTRVNFALILTVTKRRLARIEGLEAERIKAEEEAKKAQKDAEEKKTEAKTEQKNLDKIKEEVSSNMSQENVRKASQTYFLNDIPKTELTDDSRNKLQEMIKRANDKPISDPSDIQKNRWGSMSTRNGKKLYAVVTLSNQFSKYYNVSLRVRPVILTNKLEGPIAFFVHDSFGFPDNVVISQVDPETSEARVDLVAYEAFTVGALCMDGTELELDLNEAADVPDEFRWSKK